MKTQNLKLKSCFTLTDNALGKNGSHSITKRVTLVTFEPPSRLNFETLSPILHLSSMSSYAFVAKKEANATDISITATLRMK